MNKFLTKAAQAGFTIIELLVVIGVGGLIIGILLLKVPSAIASYKSNAEMQELPNIITNISKSFGNAQNFTGVTLDSIIRLDAFPTNRVTIPGTGAATATNRWNGAITFSPGTLNTTNDIGRLVYAGVPATECKAVVIGVGGMFRRVYVDSANSATAGAGTIVKADGAQVQEATVGTACSGANNSITYDFAK